MSSSFRNVVLPEKGVLLEKGVVLEKGVFFLRRWLLL
jgi:hypothetical protein